MDSTITVNRNATRGALLALLLVAMTAFTFGQDLILNSSQTNNGTINVNRNVVNNTAGSVSITGTGSVQFTGNGGPNTHSVQGGTDVSFYRLDMRGNRITTLAVATAVTDRLRVGYAGNTYTAGTTGFSIGALTLTLGNTSTYDGGSSAALTFGGGTVAYNSGSPQSILATAGVVAYGTLALSGAGAKNLTTGGTATAVTLTQATGALSVNENLSVSGTATVASLADITAARKFLLTAAATGGTITAMNNTLTGTLENAGNGTLTITTLTGNAGTINQSGATGVTTFTNNITNTGTIETATGTLNFSASGTQTNTSGTIQITGAGSATIGGDIATNPGTLTFNSGSSVTYSGGAQAIVPVTYGTLVAGGSANKTAASAFTVAGALTLNRTITQSSGALTLTSTTAGNVTGPGEVIGSVRRFHTFTTLQDYRFNRADVTLGTATGATDITLTMTPATSPSGTLPSPKYINRKFAITPTAAFNLERLALAYSTSPSEEQGSIDNLKIGARYYNGAAWAKLINAGYTRSSFSGAMTITGLNNSLSGVTELGMFQINFVSLANNAVLQTGAGWDEGSVPGASDDAIINHTGVTVGAAALNVATLTINAGRDLTVDQAAGSVTSATTSVAGTMTVTAANANLGVLSTSGAGSLGVGVGRTLTATTFTNNTSATSTFTGDVSLTSLTNTAGTLDFNGGASAISGAVSNAGVLNVGGTLSALTGGVGTLTSPGNISLTGIGTFNIGISGVASILSMTGTSTLSVAANAYLNVFGDLVIASGVTLSNSGTITVGE